MPSRIVLRDLIQRLARTKYRPGDNVVTPHVGDARGRGRRPLPQPNATSRTSASGMCVRATKPIEPSRARAARNSGVVPRPRGAAITG